jgi:hypothetical protein
MPGYKCLFLGKACMLVAVLALPSCDSGGECSGCKGSKAYYQVKADDGSVTNIDYWGSDDRGHFDVVACSELESDTGQGCDCPGDGVCKTYDPDANHRALEHFVGGDFVAYHKVAGPCTCGTVNTVSEPSSGCREGYSCSAANGLDGRCIADTESVTICDN